MAEYSAGTLSRAGEKFALRVDDDGNWLAKVVNRELSQPTRVKLVAEIDRILRLEKKAVHIPFTHVESKSNGYISLKHGVVTGVHSGTGNLLVSWDSGGNGQITVGYSTEVMKRLTPGEERELVRLTRQASDSAEALRNYTSQRQVYKGSRGLADQVQELLKKGEK